MATIQIENVAFHFKTSMAAVAYDATKHYKDVLEARKRAGVDIVAAGHSTFEQHCWIVEVKDYRTLRGLPGAKKLGDLPEQVERKVRHTLEDMTTWPETDAAFEVIQHARERPRRRVVLHLEPHQGKSKFLKHVPSQAFVRQKLRQTLKDIDPNPLVLDMSTTPKAKVPWSVTPA